MARRPPRRRFLARSTCACVVGLFCLVVDAVGSAPPAMVPLLERPAALPTSAVVAQGLSSQRFAVALPTDTNAQLAPHVRGQPSIVPSHSGLKEALGAFMDSVMSTSPTDTANRNQFLHQHALQRLQAPTAVSTDAAHSLGSLMLAALAGAGAGVLWLQRRTRLIRNKEAATEMVTSGRMVWPKFAVATAASEGPSDPVGLTMDENRLNSRDNSDVAAQQAARAFDHALPARQAAQHAGTTQTVASRGGGLGISCAGGVESSSSGFLNSSMAGATTGGGASARSGSGSGTSSMFMMFDRFEERAPGFSLSPSQRGLGRSVGASRAAPRGGRTQRRAAPAEEGGESSAADTLYLKVLTPEGVAIKTRAQEVSLPGVEGRLGILQGHAPLLAPVDVGVLRFKYQGTWKPIVVQGGYASVEGDIITVLVSDCEAGEDLPSMQQAQRELEEATASLEAASSRTERMRAKDMLKKASAHLLAATMLSKT